MTCAECKMKIERASGWTNIMGSVIENKDVWKYDYRTIVPLCKECFNDYLMVKDLTSGVMR